MEDHKHCIICGKAIPPEKFICSPSCEALLRNQQMQMRRTRLMTLGTFVLFFVILVIIAILRQSG